MPAITISNSLYIHIEEEHSKAFIKTMGESTQPLQNQNQSHHDHLKAMSLFPELPSLRRGPMYSAYAELREWKLRTKKAQSDHNFTLSMSAKRNTTSLTSSMAFRKENKKPTAALPPASGRQETMAMRVDSRRGRSGGASMRKSYSCIKELKEFAVEEGRGERSSGNKVVMRKSFASFRRQNTMLMN